MRRRATAGSAGESGLAVFLSEPRFENLACVLETGHDKGQVTAADIALAQKLRERGIRGWHAGSMGAIVAVNRDDTYKNQVCERTGRAFAP